MKNSASNFDLVFSQNELFGSYNFESLYFEGRLASQNVPTFSQEYASMHNSNSSRTLFMRTST